MEHGVDISNKGVVLSKLNNSDLINIEIEDPEGTINELKETIEIEDPEVQLTNSRRPLRSKIRRVQFKRKKARPIR